MYKKIDTMIYYQSLILVFKIGLTKTLNCYPNNFIILYFKIQKIYILVFQKYYLSILKNHFKAYIKDHDLY